MGDGDSVQTGEWSRRLATAIPLVQQLRGYDRGKARDDVLAGTTTAILLIPQAAAYALLAGLPPHLGLLAATAPVLIYALFGSSPHLSIGPVALVSLVAIQSLSEFAEPGSPEYISLAIQLALLVGVMQLALGALRLGFLADLVSHPVMTGFAAAAAMLIALTQLEPLLQLTIEAERPDLVVLEMAGRLGEIHVPTLLTGGACMTVLLVLKSWLPSFPRTLLLLAAMAGASWWLGPSQLELTMVGAVPSAFPSLHVPEVGGDHILRLLPGAALCVLVGFMEAFAVAKVTARDADNEVNADRELAGLGAANIASALVGGYAVGGAFSRTAVNARAGAKTNLAALTTGLLVLGTLPFVGGGFAYIPRCALAAVIVVAVVGLIDLKEFAHLWRVDRASFALSLATLGTTLIGGVRAGIAAGVALSLAVFLLRTARPVIREGQAAFRNHHVPDGVVLLRVHAPAFFGNARYLREQVLQRVDEKSEVHAVVMDASAITQLDVSADKELRDLVQELYSRDVSLHLARVTPEAEDTLERSGLLGDLEGRVHHTLRSALSAAGRPT